MNEFTNGVATGAAIGFIVGWMAAFAILTTRALQRRREIDRMLDNMQEQRTPNPLEDLRSAGL